MVGVSVLAIAVESLFVATPASEGIGATLGEYSATVSPTITLAGASSTFTVKISNLASPNSVIPMTSATITPSGFSSLSVGAATTSAGASWVSSLSGGTVKVSAPSGSSLATGASVSVTITGTAPVESPGANVPFAWPTSATGATTFTLEGAQPTVNVAAPNGPLSITSAPLNSATAGPSSAKGVVGQAFSYQLTSTGGVSPVSWSTTGTLPAGVKLSSTSGLLSGTPTTAATLNFTVIATDAVGATTTQTESVLIESPLVISGTPPVGTINAGYSYGLTSTGGVGPDTWSTTGTLPPGITLAAATGVLSGTPTSTGTYSFPVTVTDANGFTATAQESITIVSALSISASNLPIAFTGSSYSYQFKAAGGSGAYSWSVSSGTLPTGLALAPSTGILSGTPTTTGNPTFTIEVTDAANNQATQAEAMTVEAPLAISGTPTPGTVGTSYNYALSATGGTGAYTWSSAGTLPPGISLNSTNGDLFGTPTTAGTYSFQVTITDGNNSTATATESITIAAALAISASSLPDAQVGSPYSYQFTATGGTGAYSWSVSSGTLPTGLALASSTGTLSGTPTTAGGSTFTVGVTDAANDTATQPESLNVDAAPTGTETTTCSAGTDCQTGTLQDENTDASGTTSSSVNAGSSSGEGQVTITYNASPPPCAHQNVGLVVDVTESGITSPKTITEIVTGTDATNISNYMRIDAGDVCFESPMQFAAWYPNSGSFQYPQNGFTFRPVPKIQYGPDAGMYAGYLASCSVTHNVGPCWTVDSYYPNGGPAAQPEAVVQISAPAGDPKTVR
jgi:putative Ig domain-containing protein